jgi:hypothetical protein
MSRRARRFPDSAGGGEVGPGSGRFALLANVQVAKFQQFWKKGKYHI